MIELALEQGAELPPESETLLPQRFRSPDGIAVHLIGTGVRVAKDGVCLPLRQRPRLVRGHLGEDERLLESRFHRLEPLQLTLHFLEALLETGGFGQRLLEIARRFPQEIIDFGRGVARAGARKLLVDEVIRRQAHLPACLSMEVKR